MASALVPALRPQLPHAKIWRAPWGPATLGKVQTLVRIAVGLIAVGLTAGLIALALAPEADRAQPGFASHLRPTSVELQGGTLRSLSAGDKTWYEIARGRGQLNGGGQVKCLRRAGERRFPPCTVTGLVPATTYHWRECHGDRDGRSECGPARAFTTSRASVPACDGTISAGESVSEFLDRLGPGRTGCLTGGTYTVGNLDNFQPGQQLVAASDAQGTREHVTLRGTLRLKEDGIELHDLFVVGVTNPENDKVISVNRCNYCVIDHLDITSSPAYQDFQGILNNTPSRGLRITNNRIHHIGNEGGHDHGIYCRAPMQDGLIEGNWLYRNAAYGIIFYTDCDGVDFRHNVVANNGVLEDCNPDAPPDSRCPVTRSNARGISIAGEPGSDMGQTDSALVRNSIISSSARFGENALVHCYQPGAGNAVRDVVVDWSWDGRYPSGDDCYGGVSIHNFARRVDPGFRAEDRDDYRVRPGSPGAAVMGPFADRLPGPRVREPAGRPARWFRQRPAPCRGAVSRRGRARWCPAGSVTVRPALRRN